MELVKEEDFVTTRGRHKDPLYEEISAMPSGSIVRCDHGVDFDGKPEQFRQSVLYAMKRRDVAVQTRIKDNSVFIKIVSQGGE